MRGFLHAAARVGHEDGLAALYIHASYLSCESFADAFQRICSLYTALTKFSTMKASTSNLFTDIRAFAAAGPRLWNDLPAQVRRPDLSLDTFCQKLKTYLFVRGTSA